MAKLLLGCILIMATTGLASFGQEPMKEGGTDLSISNSSPTNDPDFEKLMGKWIVRSVDSDGELTPAQIGQKEGDIISIVTRNDRAFFG